jgi:hypothetical protein
VVDEPTNEDTDSRRDLRDDTVVVRGGFMGVRSLMVSAFRCFDSKGYFAWSFWARPGATADEIVREARFGHDHIRESTVGRLRAAGFDPQFDRDEDDHVQVRLDEEPSEPVCQRLREAFDPARPRPE